MAKPLKQCKHRQLVCADLQVALIMWHLSDEKQGAEEVGTSRSRMVDLHSSLTASIGVGDLLAWKGEESRELPVSISLLRMPELGTSTSAELGRRGARVSATRTQLADLAAKEEPPSSASTPDRAPPRLLRGHEVPSWYRADYILTGYRPVNPSVWPCIESLTYLHNETANIYSHLLPALIALVANCLLGQYFAWRFPLASWADRLVFHLFLTSTVLCFGVSSIFHTLLCHSSSYLDLWIRLDYIAIIFQILGSFVSGLYISFYCEPLLQRTYWSMIGILGGFTAFIHLHPVLQGKEWRILRLAVFVATGFSAFVPIIHAMTIFPYDQLEKQSGLRYYYTEGALILAGVGFYASHFPESWKPTTFDIWGSSHQIFHCLVVLAAFVHFCGIMAAYEWNYSNKRCHTL